MSDDLLSSFLKPVKDSFEKFSKKYPKVTKLIGWLILFVIIYKIFFPWNAILSLVPESSKSESEIVKESIEQNFKDSTYNILILPFNDYEKKTNRNIEVERALEDRISDLVYKKNYNTTIKNKIKVKCFLEVDPKISKDSITSIAKSFKSDIVIFGDIYTIFESSNKQVNIKYLILEKTPFPFKKEYQTNRIEITSIADIREGNLIEDVDYIVNFVFCNFFIAQGDISNSKTVVDDVLKVYNRKVFNLGNSYLLANLGYNYQLMRDLDLAKSYYNRSIRINDSNSGVICNLGLIYQDFQQYDSAKICYKKSISLDSENKISYNNLGTLFYEKNDYRNAEIQYRTALMIDESYMEPYYNLGLIFEKYCSSGKKKYCDSANIYFNKTISLAPDSAIPYINLGHIYMNNISTADTAKYFFYKALSINKNVGLAHYNLGVIYKNMSFINKSFLDSAKFHYQIELKLNPNYSDAYNNLGKLYMDNFGNIDSAKICFERAIISDPKNEKPYFNLGVLYYKQRNNYELAKNYFYKSISISPNYSDAFLKLGNIYSEYFNNYDSARYCYEKTITLDSRNSEAFNNYAIILRWNFKEYELSEKYFKRAIELDPKLAAAHFNYAMLLLNEIKNLSKAKQEYLTAIRFDKKFQNQKLDEYFAKIK